MTTIADELLNDFEDSGSEKEEEQADDFFSTGEGFSGIKAEAPVKQENGSMELEGDEEEPSDADLDGATPSHLKMEDAEDEAETKGQN